MRLMPTVRKRPAMTLHRDILKRKKVVYLVIAPKPIKRGFGRSTIAYIGRTRKGADRVAPSAAYRAQEVFEERGFHELDVHLVSCKAGPGKGPWWEVLEDALIAIFFKEYGQLPLCNRKGPRRFTARMKKLFRKERIEKIIQKFDATQT
jgi:hypothetical protein